MRAREALQLAKRHHATHGDRHAVDAFLVWLALFRAAGMPA